MNDHKPATAPAASGPSQTHPPSPAGETHPQSAAGAPGVIEDWFDDFIRTGTTRSTLVVSSGVATEEPHGLTTEAESVHDQREADMGEE